MSDDVTVSLLSYTPSNLLQVVVDLAFRRVTCRACDQPTQHYNGYPLFRQPRQ